MYIVEKEIKGKKYFYLRKSVRDGDKVRSKNVAYLGKTRQDAEKKMKQIVEVKEDKPKKPVEVKELTIEDLAAFCKRKGFVFRSSDISSTISKINSFMASSDSKGWSVIRKSLYYLFKHC